MFDAGGNFYRITTAAALDDGGLDWIQRWK
jgi:hypothetical protein